MSRALRPAKPPPSARIYFLPAAESPRVVVARRKPAKLWHIALLNADKGTIEHGSWFRGTFYHDCSDLSPDGEFLVYHALGSDGRTSWTGVCEPPRLRTLWHIHDIRALGGGGLWLSPRTLFTNARFNTGLAPRIPMSTRKSKPVPRFDLAGNDDKRAERALKRRADRADQAIAKTAAHPNLEWTECASFALDYKDRLLVSRQGAIEIWTDRDLKRQKPSHRIDLEHLQQPPRDLQSPSPDLFAPKRTRHSN